MEDMKHNAVYFHCMVAHTSYARNYVEGIAYHSNLHLHSIGT